MKYLPFSLRYFLVFFYQNHYYYSLTTIAPDLDQMQFIRLKYYKVSHMFFTHCGSVNNYYKIPKAYSFIFYRDLLHTYKEFDTNLTLKTFMRIISYKLDLLYPKIQYNLYTRTIGYMFDAMDNIFLNVTETLFKNQTLRIYSRKSFHQFRDILGEPDSLNVMYRLNSFKLSVYNPLPKKLHYISSVKAESDDFNKIIKQYSNFYIKHVGKKNYNLYAPFYMYSKIKTLLSKRVTINIEFKRKLAEVFKIKYQPSDVTQYLTLRNIKKYNILYIRRNKIFNKGRYSRNRQLYRTGVY